MYWVYYCWNVSCQYIDISDHNKEFPKRNVFLLTRLTIFGTKTTLDYFLQWTDRELSHIAQGQSPEAQFMDALNRDLAAKQLQTLKWGQFTYIFKQSQRRSEQLAQFHRGPQRICHQFRIWPNVKWAYSLPFSFWDVAWSIGKLSVFAQHYDARKIFCEVKVTSYIWPSKSYHFILQSKLMLVPKS